MNLFVANISNTTYFVDQSWVDVKLDDIFSSTGDKLFHGSELRNHLGDFLTGSPIMVRQNRLHELYTLVTYEI